MTLRVLVVDDAPAVARLHGMFVSAHPGCTLIGTAASGPEALQAIRTLAPDLVLLDVHLPGFSGIDVLRTVRAEVSVKQPDVVAVTAARDIDTVRDARMMGVRHYLVKPFTAQELHERITDVIHDRTVASEGKRLDQADIDAVMRPVARRAVPKGLTLATLSAVRDALAALGGATAAELAAELGLSRVSCRRYLEHLADEGSVQRTMDYATSGRPSTRYLMNP